MFKFIKLLKESAKREEEAQEADRKRKEEETIDSIISRVIEEKTCHLTLSNYSFYACSSIEHLKYREIVGKTLIAFIPKIPEYLAMNQNSIINTTEKDAGNDTKRKEHGTKKRG